MTETTTPDVQALAQQTLWSRLSEVGEQFAEKEALVSVDTDGREQRVTYRELVESVRSASAALVQAGVRSGDRLTLWMTNSPDWIRCYFGALRIGAVVVPVNTWLKPSEIHYVIEQSRSRHLVILDSFRGKSFTAMLEQICPQWRGSKAGFLHSPELPELRTVVVVPRDGSRYEDADGYDFCELADDADGAALALADELERQVDPQSLALIKYTSGSTGFPKGAMLTQGGVVANALLHTEQIGVAAGGERWFSSMPFFHVGGSVWGLMSTLMRGSTLVFLEAWDPVLALQLVERERCTVVFAVPAMMRDMMTLLRGGGHDLSSVWTLTAQDPGMVREVHELIPSATAVLNPFGLTETYGPATVTSPRDPAEPQTTTCGRVLPGYECRVVAPGTDTEVAPGVPGEALVRGNVTRGYWDKPTETAAAIDADGWLHTGDLASLDADGYLTYIGRIKSMLKVGGENVSVEEVENCILQHAAILECIVVGVPDPRKDQVGRAYLVLEEGESTGAEELRDWCTERLASFKVPRDYVFVESLPHTGSGKIDRAAVQEMAGESARAVRS